MKISGTTTDTVLDIKEFSGGKLKNEAGYQLAYRSIIRTGKTFW